MYDGIEESVSESAYEWVKANRIGIIDKFANPARFEKDLLPTTVFMAGSPGAGKTEISKRLIEIKRAVRIDADEIRELCPRYDGLNAHFFQRAASKGVDILFDHILEKKLNAVIDGTFAHNKAIENIDRSLKRGRTTEIVFVYQDPFQAWDFTRKREELEKRRITKERFVESFFDSRNNVSKAKEVFGQRVSLTVIIKDFKNDIRKVRFNVGRLDKVVKNEYNPEQLINLLP